MIDDVVTSTNRMTRAKWFEQYVLHLRSHKHIALAVFILAFILIRIPDLPEWAAYIDHNGLTLPALREILFFLLGSSVSITVFIVIFSISTRNASEMVDRPGRFILTLVLGATTAIVCGIESGVLLGVRQQFGNGDIDSTADLFDNWVQHLIWGALFGWLYILYRQRDEDATKFAGVLTARSLLTRQVAQSRLVATRAQIEPEMVARVLHKVHDYYRVDADKASALLDHMISYLRLAMNRVRETAPSLNTELTLCRSYVVLLEAETATPISLLVDAFSQVQTTKLKSTVPLFLITRQLMNHVTQENMKCMDLQINTFADHVQVSAEVDAEMMQEEKLAELRKYLDELVFNRPILLQHRFLQGKNRYLVRIDIP